ncbi:alpha/beta hydrolase [Streptomyces sp. NBC_00893]|uniref:alpha/beta hydrolase n=1 Tax=Streptomyces sp. NBC_00893 TaxID=2975862 RepID=UPI00224CDFC5|nr:alpha/beta hydrolase [Streptomyces sp. NBC_00893]MCX4851226.1 alpha/beta hydrolase [Streptomyces sp. NBC_00893]
MPRITESRTHYTSPCGAEPPLLVWEPPDGSPTALVLFFHGGGWRSGAPEQFAPQARLLAADGVLATSAGYRLIGRDARTLADCLADARAAVEHVRRLAPDLPLFLAGGSAGGQLALTTALTAPAGHPPLAGVVLFNPVVDLCGTSDLDDALRELLGLSGPVAAEVSPMRLVGPGAPPALVLHGTADELVPIADARRFRDAMAAAGHVCRLVEYEGAPHGFFNPEAGAARWFEEPMAETVAFVRSHSPSRTRKDTEES